MSTSSSTLASAQRVPPTGPPGAPTRNAQPTQPRPDSTNIRRSPAGYVMDFQDQDIRVVLSAVAEAGNLNVTFANLPTKRVTLRMSTAVSREELIDVMRGIAESNQLQMIQNGSFIRIEGVAPVTPQQQQQALQQQQAALAAQQQLRLYTYRLKHVSAITVAPVLMSLISGVPVNRQTLTVGPGGTQIITIPNAIQGNPAGGGGRGNAAPGGGRGGVQEFAVTGAASTQVQNARAFEQLQAITSSFLDAAAGGGANAANLRNQILGQMGGINAGVAAGQQVQPSAPGTLSSAANDIRIVAEESTNSLMIRATAQDYQILTQLIQTVDLRPLQVLIEVTIAEVSRNRDLNVGISGSATSRRSRDTADVSFPSAATARDFVLMLTGGKGAVNYDVAINALQTRGDVKVLSMPVIIAQNNKEAVLNVGSQRPFVQVTQTVPNDPTGRVQTIQYVDVGKKLTITPTINADGYVNLTVNQTDDIATNEVQFNAPVISKREATTQVFLRNGQTTVIGGLADNDQRKTTSGIPILSHIPLIGGWLFGNTVENKVTSELFLFLTPHIISDDADIDRLRNAVKDNSDLLQDMQLDPRLKLQQPLPIAPTGTPVRPDSAAARTNPRPPARSDTTRRPPTPALGDTSRKVQVPIKPPLF
ncbi:MAG: type II secretion system protein GspD [Gemmatimonas sp.]